jgi:hypothetical protein
MLSIKCYGHLSSSKILYGVDQLRKVMNSSGIPLGELQFVPKGACADHPMISIGVEERAGETSARLQTAAQDKLGREGYTIRNHSKGSDVNVTIEADEDQGLLYGCLELSEQIEQGGIKNVHGKTENSFLQFRGAKCNLPWEAYQEGYSTDINQETYWDLSVWERYLDHLARGRTNVLMLWSQHPYHLMVKLTKYPEACPFSDEEMADKTSFWKQLFAMAKARGMDVYMLTWNIHIHEKFSQARGFPIHGYDHPTVRDYLREAIKEIIAVYDDLSGFGTNPGERMYDFRPGAFEDYMLDVYFRALKEAARQVPFIFRSNWLPADVTREIVAKANYPGKVYIDLKFNTSHGLSTWKLNGRETNPFINPLPDQYRMLWHIRNEEAYILQWGDPQYVRDHVVNNYDPNISEGYFFGPERVIPFLEEVRLDQEGQRIQTYDFDRRWYMYEMWGRMGYNPDTPADYWKHRLSKYYGLQSGGDSLYNALRAASQVPLEFNTFWAGSWDATAYAEGNLGFTPALDGWDGSRERRFISVTDFIFHNCLDPVYMTIPEYVNTLIDSDRHRELFGQSAAGRVTPLDVADRMAASMAEINSYLNSATDMDVSIADPDTSRQRDWLMEDLQIWSGMAEYYFHKIRASTYLYGFMHSGDEYYQELACEQLLQAAEVWKSTAEYTSSRIARQGYDHFNVFHWERYVEDAYKDIELAKQVKPFDLLAKEIRCYQLGAYPSDGWGTSMDRAESPESAFQAWSDSIESGRIEQYLSSFYTLFNKEHRWQPIPEFSPSLDILKGNKPVEMVHELSKRYDIRVDLESLYGPGQRTAYIAAVVVSDRDEAVHYELRTMDFARIWINGAEVFQSPKATWYTQGHRGGKFPALLRKGRNLILIKIEATRRPLPPTVVKDRTDPEGWGFHLQKGFIIDHFDRHHIYPHTIKGLKK